MIFSAAKVTPKRSIEPTTVSFKNSAQKAADHLALTIDGKSKEFEATTYANVKTILKNIQKSSYFEKASEQSQDASEESSLPPTVIEEISDDKPIENGEDAVEPIEPAAVPIVVVNVTVASTVAEKTETFAEATNKIEFQEAPSASAVPVPTFAAPHAHAVPPNPALTATQNIKTLPQGNFKFLFLFLSLSLHIFLMIFFVL